MRIPNAGRLIVVGLVLHALHATPVSAQPLGTFRWQLQPFCNVLALNVTQSGGIFTLDGVDNLCGAATSAAAVGIAFPKPDGTFGLGLTIVLAAGAAPLHVSATINVPTISGTWQDSGGNTGAFVFNPAIAPGSPRPTPKTVFPGGLSAGNTTIINVAPPVSTTDAATKGYVDQTVNASSLWLNINSNATIRSSSPNLAGATVVRAPGFAAGFYCIRFPAGVSIQGEAAVGSVQQLFGGAGEPSRLTVTRTFGSGCNPVGFNIAVQTFDAAGALADRPFMVFVPR